MRPVLITFTIVVLFALVGFVSGETVETGSTTSEESILIKRDSLSIYEFSIPRRKYTMIGIPCLVRNGDPARLFRDDFDDRRPGHPRWRVSRWDVAKAKYVRYKEKDSPNRGWNRDPANFTPGLGFWVVQNIADSAVLDIDEHLRIGSVAQDKMFSVSINRPEGGNRGLTQLANPYMYPYDWRSTFVSDGIDTLEIDSAAYYNWINGYAYIWDILKEQYVAVNFHPIATSNFKIGVWNGFWVEQLIQDKDISILLPPKGYQGAKQSNATPQNGWALNLSLTTSDGDYGDDLNVIGVNPSSEDDYDYLDAMQFYPMTDTLVQMFFPHLDLFPRWPVQAKRFTYDYRSTDFSSPKAWDFTISILYLPDREFILTWPNINDISEDYEFILKNADTGEEIVNLREIDRYTFRSSEKYIDERHFYIIVTYLLEQKESETKSTVERYGLVSAFSSPFSEIIYVSYLLSASQEVILRVFDLGGREVALLDRGHYASGLHHVAWDASRHTSGIYILRLEAGDDIYTRKMVVFHQWS